MQITIFGASGRVGQLVVAAALATGHDVVAFAHHRPNFTPHDHLRIVTGDIYKAEGVATAIAGSEVVISALGSWGTARKDVLTVAMRHIIPAMEASQAQRIISLTGSDARADGDTLSVLHRLSYSGIKLVPGLRKILSDGEQHIALLEASQLDWTVVRSPVMNERGTSAYVLTDKRPAPWSTVNRQAVADSLINLLEDDSQSRLAPFIARA
jgi:putative NADH-flavin reductase